MTKKSKFLIAFVLVLILTILFSVGFIVGSSDREQSARKEKYIQFENKKFEIKWAGTEKDRAKGLSGTTTLDARKGLMFEFPVEGIYGIWMKDMNYAIDIIWMDESFRVVHIESDISPKTYPKIFQSSKPAKFVLEINSGLAEKNMIKLKDVARIF